MHVNWYHVVYFWFQNPHRVMRGPVFTVGSRGCDLSIRDQSMPSVLCELRQMTVWMNCLICFVEFSTSPTFLLIMFFFLFKAAGRSFGCLAGDYRDWSCCSGQWQGLPKEYLCSSAGWWWGCLQPPWEACLCILLRVFCILGSYYSFFLSIYIYDVCWYIFCSLDIVFRSFSLWKMKI